jgi:hypothetical protein
MLSLHKKWVYNRQIARVCSPTYFQ